jgi:hypothetical protein
MHDVVLIAQFFLPQAGVSAHTALSPRLFDALLHLVAVVRKWVTASYSSGPGFRYRH